MISIRKQPYTCSFTGNNMIFKVGTNMRYITQRVSPMMTLTFSGLSTNGEFMIFNFQNPETGELEIIKIHATAKPINEGDVEGTGFIGTTAEYVQHVFEVLQKIVVLNAFYTISINGLSIKIVAKEAMEELQLINFQKVGMANIIATNKNGFVEPLERTGYKLIGSVYLETKLYSGNFQFVSNIGIALDENSEGFVNVAPVLHQGIESSWQQMPYPNPDVSHYMANNGRRYYVEFMEEWTGEVNRNKVTSNILFAHWGGHSTDNANLVAPLAQIDASQKFLTHHPSGKIVHEEQHDWLSWINTAEALTVKLKIRVFWWEGGSVENSETDVFTKLVNPWETLVFKSGPKDYDLYNLTGQFPCMFYEMRLVNNATNASISETYRFNLNQVFSEKKTILFFNGYGLPETIFTTGPWVETYNSNKLLAQRSQQFNLSRLRPSTFVFKKESNTTFQAETQVFPKKTAARLTDLLNTGAAMLYDEAKEIPIIIEAVSADVDALGTYTMRLPLSIRTANVSKELSFHDLMPALGYTHDEESTYLFTIEKNGLVLASVGTLTVLFEGAAFATSAYNSGTGAFAPIVLDLSGRYKFSCDVVDSAGLTHKLIYHLNHNQNKVLFETYETGSFSVTFERNSGTSSMDINWDKGAGTITYPLTTNTVITQSYSNTNLKRVNMLKSSFADITGFISNSLSILKMDWSAFKKLTNLRLLSADHGPTIYLNNLPQLTNLQITGSSSTTNVELDYMPNLSTLTLSSLGLTAQGIEDLIARLHSFRKLMNTNPTIVITGFGGTVTARTTAMLQGTGEFLGQGLVVHYAWSVTIS